MKNHGQIDPYKKQLSLKNDNKIFYSHFINCAGLRADEVAQKFGLQVNIL